MGLESFYIKFKTVESQNIKEEDCCQILEKLKTKKRNDEFIFNDSIVLFYNAENYFVTEIVLIGCFSSYQSTINDMIDIIKSFSKKYKIHVFHELGIDLIYSENDRELSNLIKDIYQNQYSEFVKMFGEVNFKSLHNMDFYRKIRKVRLLSKLKKFFKR